MKSFFTLLTVLAVVGTIHCQYGYELSNGEKIKVLKRVIGTQTLKEKVETLCPGTWPQYQNATLEVVECLTNINEDEETVCSTIKRELNDCFTPMVKFFEECLPERARDIPVFIVDVLKSVTTYVCKVSSAEQYIEIFNPCFKKNNARTNRCVRLLLARAQQYKNTFPSKDEVCEFMTSFKGCAQSHVHASCLNPVTRQAFVNMYDAFLKPCIKENEVNAL